MSRSTRSKHTKNILESNQNSTKTRGYGVDFETPKCIIKNIGKKAKQGGTVAQIFQSKPTKNHLEIHPNSSKTALYGDINVPVFRPQNTTK